MYVQADRFLKLMHEIHNILTLNKLRALVLRVHSESCDYDSVCDANTKSLTVTLTLISLG